MTLLTRDISHLKKTKDITYFNKKRNIANITKQEILKILINKTYYISL